MPRQSLTFKLSVAMCALTFALCVFGGAYVFALYEPIEYVTVDVNPGVEMWLNRFGRVIVTRVYYADEGEAIGQLRLEGLRLRDATERIVRTAVSAGYVPSGIGEKDAALLVTAASEHEGRARELAERCARWADDELAIFEAPGSALYAGLPMSAAAQAHRLRMSTGRLYMLSTIQSGGADPVYYAVGSMRGLPTRELLMRYSQIRRQQEENETAM